MLPLAALHPHQRSLAEAPAGGPRRAWELPEVPAPSAPSYAHSGLLAMLGGHPAFPHWPRVGPAGPEWFLPAGSRGFFPMVGMPACTPSVGLPAVVGCEFQAQRHATAAGTASAKRGQRKRSHAGAMHTQLAGQLSDGAAERSDSVDGVQPAAPAVHKRSNELATAPQPGGQSDAVVNNEHSEGSNSRVSPAFWQLSNRVTDWNACTQ